MSLDSGNFVLAISYSMSFGNKHFFFCPTLACRTGEPDTYWARFRVHTATSKKVPVFWDVAPCILAENVRPLPRTHSATTRCRENFRYFLTDKETQMTKILFLRLPLLVLCRLFVFVWPLLLLFPFQSNSPALPRILVAKLKIEIAYTEECNLSPDIKYTWNSRLHSD